VEDRGENGSELSRIGDIHISRLEFGEVEVPRKRRTVPNWLYNKMRKPRIFKNDLKMPDYHFSDEQSEAVTTYLLSLTAESPVPVPLSAGRASSDYKPQDAESRKKCRCWSATGSGKGDPRSRSVLGRSRVRGVAWLHENRTPSVHPVERMIQLKMPDVISGSSIFFAQRSGRSGESWPAPNDAPQGFRNDSERRKLYPKIRLRRVSQINLIRRHRNDSAMREKASTGRSSRLRNPKTFPRSVEPVYDFRPEESKS
jgi:hypothetical protein